jgi:hypothetical protein
VRGSIRFAFLLATLVVFAPGAAAFARSQPPGQTVSSERPTALVNGDMETLDAEGKLTGWFVQKKLIDAGYVIGPTEEGAFAGKRAARIDSRAAKAERNSFGNLSQSIDATPWRGKHVRFRAMVAVTEGGGEGRAQLWFRVDRTSADGTPSVGFFDNMGDRPITSPSWARYEIVGDVADDAQSILMGVLTIGPCVVLFDDASLEVADSDVASTGMADVEPPPEPFFTPWLLLPLVALSLFGLSLVGCGRGRSGVAGGRVGGFALAFTITYWSLNCFTTLVSSLVPFVGERWGKAFEAGPIDRLVRWTARVPLGIKGELVSAIANGSGDTTYSYVEALDVFVLALGLAIAWSLADRSLADRARPRDLLRSGLRWYLATYMITYGLAKLSTLSNQFPPPGLFRLAQPYGESSPMGLLWTFMGSSRPYTAIAGGMELLGGLLLVWRRTALLGVCVSIGVMLNVMLMNFCYDVPVKLFSAHLVVAGVCILLPDVGRLAGAVFGTGAVAPRVLAPPIESRRAIWIHRGSKAVFVVLVVAMPLYNFWSTERSTARARPALGEWKLATLKVDGQAVTPAAGEVQSLTLVPRPTPIENDGSASGGDSSGDGWKVPCSVTLIGGEQVATTATLTTGRVVFEAITAGNSALLREPLEWSVAENELRLERPGLQATLTPAAQSYLLVRRGFHWVNEHPYNR